MSQENVELVRRLNECFAPGEHEWPFTVYHPEIVWEPIQVTGIDPVYRGHEGVRRGWRDWFSAFSDVEFEIERYIDAGEEVVVILRVKAVGRASGVPTELGPYAQIWTIRDGLCVAMQVYADVEEGLRAAGVNSD